MISPLESKSELYTQKCLTFQSSLKYIFIDLPDLLPEVEKYGFVAVKS